MPPKSRLVWGQVGGVISSPTWPVQSQEGRGRCRSGGASHSDTPPRRLRDHVYKPGPLDVIRRVVVTQR